MALESSQMTPLNLILWKSVFWFKNWYRGIFRQHDRLICLLLSFLSKVTRLKIRMCRAQSVNRFTNLPLQYITTCMPFVNNQVTSIRFTTYKFIVLTWRHE